MYTRSEWVTELKRYLSILPQKEQEKAYDYYAEIFQDKFENGMNEKDIVESFGDPYDAAKNIIEEYQTDNPSWVRPKYDESYGDKSSKASSETDNSFRPAGYYKEPKKTVEGEFKPTGDYRVPYKEEGSSGAVGTLLCVLIGIILYPTAFSIAFSLLTTSFACMLGGASGIVMAISSAVAGGGGTLFAIGVSLIGMGFGLAILYPVLFGSKWMFKGILNLFKVIKSEFTKGGVSL